MLQVDLSIVIVYKMFVIPKSWLDSYKEDLRLAISSHKSYFM